MKQLRNAVRDFPIDWNTLADPTVWHEVRYGVCYPTEDVIGAFGMLHWPFSQVGEFLLVESRRREHHHTLWRWTR